MQIRPALLQSFADRFDGSFRFKCLGQRLGRFLNRVLRLRRPLDCAQQARRQGTSRGFDLRRRIAAGGRIIELDQTPIRRRDWMLLVIGRRRVERLHPERLLGNRTFDRPVIFPACFQPHATDWPVEVAAIDEHVTERQRDRLWCRPPILKLGKPNQYVDEQGLRVAVVGIVVRSEMKI